MTTLLEISGLNTYYGESHILRDVDLSVKAEEMVCLIGRNGVGKTTLLKSLIGLLRPRSGEVLLNGAGLDRQAPYQRARAGIGKSRVARSSQALVEENLMLGMEALPGGLAVIARSIPSSTSCSRCCRTSCSARAISVAVNSSSWPSPCPAGQAQVAVAR